MRIITAALLAFVALSCSVANAGSRPTARTAPVEVMVLGSYHFGNPGLDLNNVKADDVLKPSRQRELNALARAIAKWKPTKIMVEREVDAPDLVDPAYASFTPEKLATSRDERVQIAYRAANLLKLAKVYGIDEQPGPGEPDYFPFDKVAAYAAAHGQQGMLDGMMAVPERELKAFEALQVTQTIPQLLEWHNDPNGFAASIAGYYGLLAVGDTSDQPGAELNAMWYLRNAKIFAKLMRVAQPGDRVLVVYGAGHGYWLRHFARETPGFVSVSAMPMLQSAAQAARSDRR